jgi:hypothetical protein
MSIVVTYLKDFSGGLKENGQQKLGKQLATSTRNVRDPELHRWIDETAVHLSTPAFVRTRNSTRLLIDRDISRLAQA